MPWTPNKSLYFPFQNQPHIMIHCIQMIHIKARKPPLKDHETRQTKTKAFAISTPKQIHALCTCDVLHQSCSVPAAFLNLPFSVSHSSGLVHSPWCSHSCIIGFVFIFNNTAGEQLADAPVNKLHVLPFSFPFMKRPMWLALIDGRGFYTAFFFNC